MSKVWDFVKGVAPSLAGLAIGGPFAPVASLIVAKAVGAPEPTEKSIGESIALMGEDKAATAIAAAQEENKDQLLVMEAENARIQLQETHKTARAEINSDDEYVRRWRPAFGYAVRDCFLIQVGGSSFMVLIAMILEAAGVLEQGYTLEIIRAIGQMIGATTIIWTFALSILGVNIHARSQDKAVQAGQEVSKNPGMIRSLFNKFV